MDRAVVLAEVVAAVGDVGVTNGPGGTRNWPSIDARRGPKYPCADTSSAHVAARSQRRVDTPGTLCEKPKE
jgi:hypothetical protein